MNALPRDQRTLVLLAASLLAVPARRLRALARGEDEALRTWLASESATRLAEARRDARKAFERLQSLGARLVALDDAEYPAPFLQLDDPPPFVIVRGTSIATPAPEGVAIVGTREPSAEAFAFAGELARHVAPPVVSGLARGIDTAAHRGALESGLRTIAYVGYGFGAVLPPKNGELERSILEAGGAVVSERLPDLTAVPWALVKRDRLQAAHAVAIVMVQSESGGGAMHTLRFAERLGRRRFVCSPLQGERYSGNVTALAAGACELSWDAKAAGLVIMRALGTS